MRKLFINIIAILLFFSGMLINAKDYKAEVAQLPTTDSYLALIKAIGEETNNNFVIEVTPMARTIYLIENKQVDISGPGISNQDPKKLSAINHDFTTTSITKAAFILYTNNNKAISVDDLKNGNPANYKIEVNPTIAPFLNFHAELTTSLEASFKKVASGAIDGFIESQMSGDDLLKKNNLKNIKRTLYDKFDVVFRLPKGTKGGEIDKIFSLGIEKLKANWKFDKIMGSYIKQASFIDWQP